MLRYYELLLDISLEEVEEMKASISAGTVNPMQYKQKLAREMVTRYHSGTSAQDAENRFILVHKQKGLPENIPERTVTYITQADLSLIKILRSIANVKSNTEARRLIEQGAVKVEGTVIRDVNYAISPENRQVIIQLRKRTFAKVKCVKQ
jgi:tyrosyl-tRNA synthetase